jgi:hypothetical protein
MRYVSTNIDITCTLESLNVLFFLVTWLMLRIPMMRMIAKV